MLVVVTLSTQVGRPLRNNCFLFTVPKAEANILSSKSRPTIFPQDWEPDWSKLQRLLVDSKIVYGKTSVANSQ